jgi:hypothetical protein
MMRRVRALTCVLLVATVSLAADESSVQFDPKADFSLFRTFSFRTQQVDSRREELDNPLFLKKLATAIRQSLIARGLAETSGPSDLLVDFTVTGQEFGDAQRKLIRGVGPGGPVRITRPIRITEGTLVIDLVRRTDGEPIWRGVYRDDEQTGSKLVTRLPEDARKLVRQYPGLK